MSSWDLAHVRIFAAFGPLLYQHDSRVPAIYAISLESATTWEWTKSYFMAIAMRHVHLCGSMTPINAVTLVQTLLNARFVPSWMTKGNSRFGMRSGENGFKIGRGERVVCGPIVE